MPVKILIPTPLRGYTERQASLNLEGVTVAEVLDNLLHRYPPLKQHLYGTDGRLRNYVNVYVNDEDIRYREKEGTRVSEGDVVSIVPSIAGGSQASHAVDERVQLTREEFRRYGRHLIMPEVGLEGQERLKASKVLLVGAGGLGSPAALYLAAAGVGTLGIVDFDVVDETNLHRQIIHSTKDIGRPKLQSAEERIKGLNPNVRVRTYETRLTSENALEILKDYDVVVDGTDNFPTRYLVNDACVILGIPNVYGSIFRFEGQVSVFASKDGPCYRCLYSDPPPPGLVPSCAEGGVLGVLPGIVGTLQANEALKVLLGIGSPLVGRLLLVDALEMQFRELKLRKNPACPVCGEHPTLTRLIDYEQFCGILPHAEGNGEEEMTVEELKQHLDRGEDFTLLDVREPHEYEIVNMGGTLIPLGELPGRVRELDSAWNIVVHCHSGGRSARAVRLLKDLGFKKVKNLAGGIDRWAEVIDPSLPRY